jgi:uncharacterized membrane protein
MKPLIVLLVSFGLSLTGFRLFSGQWQAISSGNTALCLMLCFTAIGHFAFTEGMEAMIPPFIPARKALVIVTGVLEIVAGLLLLCPPARQTTGIFLILFFILLLPANVYAALHHLNYQTGEPNGAGLAYLWFRVPLQVLFIGWAWYFAIHLPTQQG